MSSEAILEKIAAMPAEGQRDLLAEATRNLSAEAVADVWAILETRRRRFDRLADKVVGVSHENTFSKARAALQ